MKGLIQPTLDRIQGLLSQSYITQINIDNKIVTLGHIISKIELKEFPCDWGYLVKFYIKGSLPTDIGLEKCDCFSVIMKTLQGDLRFEAAVSEISWRDGELVDLKFTSYGPILGDPG